MRTQSASSRHFQRKISDFCDVRIAIDDDEHLAFRSSPDFIGARHRPSLMPKSGPAPYWRFAMATKRKFKSDALEAIHSAVEDMYAAGTIDKETMKTFD